MLKVKKTLYLIIILVGVLFISGCGNNKITSYEQLMISDVILIKDNGYKMYNQDGKRITKQVFTWASSFKNGLSIVRNKDNEYGIINSNGKMVVSFGKYKHISREDFLFEATDDDNNKYLLNSKGKVAIDLKDKKLGSFLLDRGVVAVDSDKEYLIFDRDGKRILKIKKVDDKEGIKISELEGNYTSIMYNDMSYIVNVVTKKVVAKVSGNYSVSSMNTINRDRYVLYDRSTSQDNPTFRLMKKGKTIFTIDTCTNLFYEYNNNNLLCAKSVNGRYVINDKKELLVEIYKSDVSYIDGRNYIDKVDLKNTQFYVDGKKKSKVDCYRPYSVSKKSKIYNLEGSCSETAKKVAFYDVKGKKLFVLDDVNSASKFDDNGLSIVRNTKDQYYLINKSKKVVSKKYERIYEASQFSGFYTAKNGDKYYLINKDGKEIDYSDDSISGGDGYYKLVQNKKNIYYTYNGVKIKK